MLYEVFEAIKKGAILHPGEYIVDVVDYEGLYEVTNFGRVWGIKRQHWLNINIGSINGYQQVNLCKNGVAITTSVHTIVLNAIKGKKKHHWQECRHLDGNPLNNHIDNLEWGDGFENYEDRVKHGTDNNGMNNGRAVLTYSQVKEIRRLYEEENISVRQLADKFNVTTGAIYPIVNGRHWS